MGRIQSMKVDGFWDTHDLQLSLYPEVTFIIGQNGTGKTTLINLLAAALTADIRTLTKTSFRKISIDLEGNTSVKGPQLIIQKGGRKERREEYIEYRIKSNSKNESAKEWKLPLEEGDDGTFNQRYLLYLGDARRSIGKIPAELSKELNSLVQVNWLSVHRTPTSERARDERPFESAVDQRLENLSNELVRYFSTLSRQRENEIRQFQESIFVSLVEEQQEASLFETSELSGIDKTVDTLGGVFEELHVSSDNAKSLLTAYLAKGKEIDERINKANRKKDPFQLNDAIYLLGLKRVSNVVKRWNELQIKTAKIFSPRDRYVKIVNELFQRKSMEITASNEWKFTSRSGKELKIELLSSGEKQLLILLTETLLQREVPAIFIADEPELSLHVLWQEKIIASLRFINPNAQIVAATHSPDIVGNRADCTLDMEQIIP